MTGAQLRRARVTSGRGHGGPMTSFDEATAVRHRGKGRYDAAADARFAVVVPGGTVPPAVNGGALLATLTRGVLDTSPHPHPVATSAHFLRVPDIGPVEVQVTWLKLGRTAATARAALVQAGDVVVDATVTTGAVADCAADGHTAHVDGSASAALTWTGTPPGFPDLAGCVDLGSWRGTTGSDGLSGYAAHVQVLLDPATTGWRTGNPSGLPEMRGFFRLREDRDPDAYLLALAVDSLPPAVFGLGATGWAPTVELTWHMRAVPAPGPLRVASRCRHVSGGWFDEEAEVWDAAGRLVAQSRQLARVGRGPVRMPRHSAGPAASTRSEEHTAARERS
jgi:acyl-coenzyme A thioesterase PaaI-like protein